MTRENNDIGLLERWGLSGKLLAGGGLIGLISLLLPFYSVNFSINFLGQSGSQTSSVAGYRFWQGQVSGLALIGSIALSFVLYPPGGVKQEMKLMCWGGLGLGAIIVALDLFWMLNAFQNTHNTAQFSTAAGGLSAGVSFGAYLLLLAGGAITYGGFLKAREERLL